MSENEELSQETVSWKWLCRVYGVAAYVLTSFVVLAMYNIVRMPDTLFGIVFAATGALLITSTVYWVKYSKATGRWVWL